MSNKKVEILYPKATNYLSAAVEINGKYLVLRNPNEEIYQKLGCYFPGCKQNSQYEDIAYLKEQLLLKYNLKVNVQHFVGDVLVKDRNGKYSCLYLYKCAPISKVSMNNSQVKAHLLKPENFKLVKFDMADALLAERIQMFHLVYENDITPCTRNKEENEIVLVYYDSLIYFANKVAKQDVLDFQALLQTGATMEEVKNAFFWICKRSKIDLNQYIKYKEEQKQNEK